MKKTKERGQGLVEYSLWLLLLLQLLLFLGWTMEQIVTAFCVVFGVCP